ncbi:hypothetical protein B566_EDAN005435 [Ephemera danica]|nr:hypothetical protein B566_EDAN005435 [Ephemera danica]
MTLNSYKLSSSRSKLYSRVSDINTMKFSIVLLVAAFAYSANAHSYHLGSCPTVEPMAGFDLTKFFGTWYVIQKTSTASPCLVYNLTRTTDGELRLEQASEHFLLGLGNVDHVYRYTGVLTQPDRNQPAKMRIRFPLSVAGDAAYTIMMTDYENYAGVFTCQKMTFANRQSASILSRRPTLDKMYIDKIRTKLSSFGVDPHDLSIIRQTECRPPTAEETGLNINIDETTFTANSAANVVRKAGEKIGDGIETVASGATNLYNRVRGNRDGASSNIEDADAEWLP